MKGAKYFQSWQGSLKANKLLMGALALSLLTNIVLAMSASSKQAIVVVQPPPLSEEAWISKSDASMSMKESWGLYIATLLGNTTPRSVAGLSPVIGKIVSPGAYQQIMSALAEMKKEVESEQLEIQFSPTGVFYVPSRNVVAVSGELRMRSARGIEKRFVRTYEIGLDFRDYQPRMRSLDIYEGPFRLNPKTEE